MFEVGDIVYYARILKTTNIYTTLALKVATVYSTYFAAVDGSNQRFLFDYKDVGKIVFGNKKEAEEVVMNATTAEI